MFFQYKVCASKSVYFYKKTLFFKYTDLLAHTLLNVFIFSGNHFILDWQALCFSVVLQNHGRYFLKWFRGEIPRNIWMFSNWRYSSMVLYKSWLRRKSYDDRYIELVSGCPPIDHTSSWPNWRTCQLHCVSSLCH